MAERSVYEQWQAGISMAAGSALGGIVLGVVLFRALGTIGASLGFLGGFVVSFLAISYVVYGRK